ncbi:hypothetical protein [Chryseobacterium vrystaatense]|uniref:Uncharacterized protein n=1 Tax=Chryseobacterium vrystaatense TaxID=307480 RepID=A0A1M5JFJ8_9FLAO|nr:hypothetical protein [Chryseobacterium vrystaatense]SHG39344.1 hypothetical protein SAMN02787073_4180 [Chryseobacterium vrystaatense]
MRTLKNLNINKSIESEKLIYEESWCSRFDTVSIYFLFLTLIWGTILCFSELESFSKNGLEYTFLTSAMGFCLYALYCKFSEKRLKKIKCSISKEEAKKRILEFGKKYNYRISQRSGNLIFLNEPTDSFCPEKYEQTTIVFFKDNEILYTLIKEGVKTNFPVLFSQHLTGIEFRKILNQTKLETKKKYFSAFFNELS